MAAPMPEAAPVTTAVRPWQRAPGRRAGWSIVGSGSFAASGRRGSSGVPAYCAGLLEDHLTALGAPRATAVVTAETAPGCCQAARRLAGDDAGALVREVEQSFRTLLAVRPAASPGRSAGR